MAKSRAGSDKEERSRGALIDAMAELVGDAREAIKPLSKRAGKELRSLEKRLVAARAIEVKRLRQLAQAQGSKGRKEVGKRSRQAGEAASEVAAIAGRIANLAASVAGRATDTVGGAAGQMVREVGNAAAQAAEAVSPVKAPSLRTPVATRSTAPSPPAAKPPTSKPATARSTPAAAATPPSSPAKPAVARKPATRRKPATTRTTGPASQQVTPPAGDGAT